MQKQFGAERLAVWRHTCPGRDCNVVTATDEDIAAVRADSTHRVGWVPRWCPPCAERDALERAERQRSREESQRQAEEHRRQRVAEPVDWPQAPCSSRPRNPLLAYVVPFRMPSAHTYT